MRRRIWSGNVRLLFTCRSSPVHPGVHIRSPGPAKIEVVLDQLPCTVQPKLPEQWATQKGENVRSADSAGVGTTPASAGTVSEALDNAPLSAFHRRAVAVSGVGFFTDAYDLFVISTVAALVAAQWHLSTSQTSWVLGSAILGAFVGATVFGRVADLVGRKKILSARGRHHGPRRGGLGPGHQPAVAHPGPFRTGPRDWGRLPRVRRAYERVRQPRRPGAPRRPRVLHAGIGANCGPLVALGLLEAQVGDELTWRLLLAFGALPALGVIYLRSKIPESPRFQSMVRGRSEQAAAELATFSAGVASPVAARTPPPAKGGQPPRLGLFGLLRDRRTRRLLIGTAGAWFVFDYAYYGNTLSLPAILKGVDPGADLAAKLAWSLAMFVVFALPGYAFAVWWMDRIGHRRLQLVGFGVLGGAFLLLAAVPVLTTSVGAFLAVFGLSYFFVEFGPNMTTFVLPSEVFPVSARTTGHGISAGVGKLGAFLGVFVVPALQTRLGLRPMLAIAAVSAVIGIFLTRLLPEAARRNLDEVCGDNDKAERCVPGDEASEQASRPSLAQAG